MGARHLAVLVTRHVPRRRGDPHPREFERLPFHGWYGCKGCGAVVYDWPLHECHEHENQAAELELIGPADLAERANAEGRAVVGAEFTAAHPWLEAWRQVAACLRLRPPRDPARPLSQADPPAAAGRAEQWAAIDGLIKRTTEA